MCMYGGCSLAAVSSCYVDEGVDESRVLVELCSMHMAEMLELGYEEVVG